MNILRKVYSTISGYDLIREGEGIVLAVSGGPDSMSMLHILKEINEIQRPGWKLYIAHLNHGIRGKEADDDEIFVRDIAKKLDIPFFSRKVSIPQLKTKSRASSMEEVARNVRHEYLKEVAREVKAQKIALAHNFDDQAETILHRILRGTGLRGLKGMVPVRLLSRKEDLFIIRPLIELERQEIEVYLADRKIPFRLDATNDDITITRNRIRHTLIPLLEKEFNPRVKLALVKLGQTSASFYILLREIASEIFENMKMISGENEVCVSVDEFVKTPPAIQTLIVDKCVKMLLGKLPQLNFEHYIEILNLCGDQGLTKVITLPKGVQVKREAYLIKFFKPQPIEPAPKLSPQKVKIPGRTIIKKINLEIDSEVMEGKVAGLSDYIQKKDFSEELIDLDKIEGDLTLRFRKRGDIFNPLGARGSVKLKKFFIDSKVPKNLRDRVPIIADKNKIIWVMGYRIGDEVKITNNTNRVLKIKFSKA